MSLRQPKEWFDVLGWQVFPFQRACWEAMQQGKSGMLNAPTGSGKTYGVLLGAMGRHLSRGLPPDGPLVIWITPLRALAQEIASASTRAVEGMGLSWKVAVRTGDTSTSQRQGIRKSPPQILITTPESLHLLLSSTGYEQWFGNLDTVVVDEWHELLGSKRGVQMELALSRLRGIRPRLLTWGISATIGNLEQALEVLMGSPERIRASCLVRSRVEKKIEVVSVIPRKMDRFPWAGHLGIKLLEQVRPLLEESESTLIFTNTRAQCEIWYQRLLEAQPDLAGVMAMHHGSISQELRTWVEQSLHDGSLKVVVCTSSLDLGVDFRPVETIVQIGSPKGVARFIQRAGRSGHQPGAVSRLYFVPTHALELIEGAALRKALEGNLIEERTPHFRSFDVLLQYLVTLACSDGFYPEEIEQEIRQTFSFQSITEEEWAWLLEFLTTGGSLKAYDEFRKLGVDNTGKFRVQSRAIAQRHRLSMGTIVSDASLLVKYVSGKKIGTVEEWFIAQLKPGDVFWFAGRSLELVRIKDMTVQVKKSGARAGKVPSWLGGRLQFSSQMSELLREMVTLLQEGKGGLYPELEALAPIVTVQQERSALPAADELLMEYFKDSEGYHLLVYPFEGRQVHEGMATVIAWRLARLQPISFSIAMNDYGFELLSEDPIPIEAGLKEGLFSDQGLSADIQASMNEVEMAKRQFRDIAAIGGLIFTGFPGRKKKDRHLQSSTALLFEVFHDYEPDNLLFLQAFEEVRQFQLDETRLRQSLRRIQRQRIRLMRPERATPFAFPIMVDRLRERLSSEKLADRVKKMTLALTR